MIKDFLCKHGTYYDDKCFKELTTLKMGGKIRHLIYPDNIDDLKEIIDFLRRYSIPYKMLGNGSNLICGESTFEGVVISLKKLNAFEIKDTEVYSESGVMGPYLANVLAKEGLSGFEFAGSIPGNIGGLVYMNAGAYKKEMSDVLKEVLVYRRGELVWLTKDELNFSYRHSIFQEHPHWVIIACKMELEKGNPEDIFDLMNDRLSRRQASQPLDKASAGSCFRNPEGKYAWQYIDEIGYRGFKRGDVEVSPKHSNFIVNNGNGTADDYLNIVYDIKRIVKDKFDVDLIMEVEKFNC